MTEPLTQADVEIRAGFRALQSDFLTQLDTKIKAGFQAMVVATHERRRLLNLLMAYGRQADRNVVVWSPPEGFTFLHPHIDDDATLLLQQQAAMIRKDAYRFDPMASLRAVAESEAFPDETLYVFLDAHDHLGSPTTEAGATRSFLAGACAGSRFQNNAGTTTVTRPVLFAQPAARLHPDVDPCIEPIRLPLLAVAELEADVIDDIARGIAGPTGLEGAGGADLRHRVAESCTGLLEMQASNVLAECLHRHGRFCEAMLPDIRAYRAEQINQSGLLKVYSGPETFRDVIGMAGLKKFLLGVLRPRPAGARALPRGVLLPGVSGSGKSLIAKALGNETGRTTLLLDIGSLLGGIVGQSEEQVRRALEIVDNAGPSVLLVDEVEKALAGLEGGGQADSGVMSRLFGTLLQWLNDHTSDVFVVMTSNDVSRLPAEFSRAERFDAIFFVDAPGPADRAALWKYYLAYYALDSGARLPADSGWTGAEIATCTRLAELLGVSLRDAAEHVVPIADTNKERIDALRGWADNRYLDATTGRRYSKDRVDGRSASAAPAARAIKARPNAPGMN